MDTGDSLPWPVTHHTWWEEEKYKGGKGGKYCLMFGTSKKDNMFGIVSIVFALLEVLGVCAKGTDS